MSELLYKYFSANLHILECMSIFAIFCECKTLSDALLQVLLSIKNQISSQVYWLTGIKNMMQKIAKNTTRLYFWFVCPNQVGLNKEKTTFNEAF